MSVNPQFQAALKNADAIIHLGAGQCQELAAYQALPPSIPVVLVEANPTLAKALERRASDNANITVLPYAVSDTSGERVLHTYNLPEVSSLRPATGLKDLFPGLRLVREVPVEAVTPAELLDEDQLANAQSICLVVDTPGEEAAILRSLQHDNAISRIGNIVLHCGQEALYEGAVPAGEVLGFLKEQRYQLEGKVDDADPDRPTWMLRINRLELEKEYFEKELKSLKAQLSREQETRRVVEKELQKSKTQYERYKTQSQSRVDALREKQKEEIARARAEKDEALTEFKSQLEAEHQERSRLESVCDKLSSQLEVNESAEQQFAHLKSQLESLKKEKDQEIDALKKQLTELTEERDSLKELQSEHDRAEAHHVKALKQLEDELGHYKEKLEQESEQRKRLDTECDELLAAKGEHEKAIQAYEKQIADVERQKETLDQEVGRLQAEAEGLNGALEEKESELRDARSDLSVAIRLQTQRDRDLKDLQERYETLLTRKEKQDALLGKLNHRLSIAAQSLRQLGADSESRTNGGDAAQELLRALSGDSE